MYKAVYNYKLFISYIVVKNLKRSIEKIANFLFCRFLSIYQGNSNIPNADFKTAIKDEHWVKNRENLSFSCTLVFTESELGPTDLWYQLPDSHIQYMGSASGPVYRIVGLKVPPEKNYLFVYISQPTPGGVPLLKKRLKISYS